MATKCTKIDTVDSLDAGFHQVPLVQKSLKIHNNVMQHHLSKISKEKQKLFYNKKNLKIQFTIEITIDR